MSYDYEHGINREEEESTSLSRRLSFQVHLLLRSVGLSQNPIPEGMRQEFIDSLDRVSKKELQHNEECPICASPFLDDPYPLVVSLPCPGRHMFDLECVSKWLKSSGTCPMCRHDFNAKKETENAVVDVDDEEEEYDDMYA